ncbi:MAG TPA: NADH-quinone oxidoreductase subunit C [Candidatus Polarisedimenticolaceae bacterium]|nr:NADH-quinone oxidoreductase subunit C [Candidatus Polarisedimenticolaceae bacterium]
MEPLDLAALVQAMGGKATPLGMEVPPQALIPAVTALREAGCRYYLLCTVTEVAAGFEIVHGLRDLERDRIVFVKTSVGKDDPRVPSVVPVFPGANWFEREMLDLFGVVFTGHPDPRRLMMPDDYPGHPLRKDFPMAMPWGYRPATEPGAP